jgi:alkaline phosphatase/alkaline phosphatase D
MFRHHLLVLLGALLVIESLEASDPAAAPVAGMGIMIGEVTAHSALIQARLTKTDFLVDGDVPGMAGVVRFVLKPADGGEAGKPVELSQTVPARADRDFIARAAFTGLQSGECYVCETQTGKDAQSLRPGPAASFRTLPGPQRTDAVRLVVVTGMNYAKFHGDNRIDRAQHRIENNTELPEAYAGPDKALGYPALATILAMKPDVFIGTGDNVYYDTPDNPRAKTVEQLRQKWHEQFVQPRYRELFAKVPTYWQIDDHDYRVDDGDNTGDYAPSPELGRRMMLEQLPVAPAGAEDALTYRTHRVSRDLQIWLTENRIHRSPNAMPDGLEKTIWGIPQREWLKESLLASDAKFKLLISPNPMIGPDDLRKTDNHTNIGGFQHERDTFFDWLVQTGLEQRHFYLVCGDRHWQYHSIHPSGIEEFSCGALVDANSRLGRKPGDPKSTDPERLIRQKYYQDPASGGFLIIDVSSATEAKTAHLTLTHFDERGKKLYQAVKQ